MSRGAREAERKVEATALFPARASVVSLQGEMHMEHACCSLSGFTAALDDLVAQTTEAHTCAAFVQRTLPDLLQSSNCLPAAQMQPAADSYARHLIHRHPHGRYVMVAMVWQPGQRTPIHDHGGVWCVEGVYQGQMHITQYDVTALEAGHVSATPTREITAGLGNVGALIPPYEYHVMANTSQETAVTLHVYGADLQSCRVFVDDGHGRYHVQTRHLHYTSINS